jgi:hypothetical protein
VLAKFIGHTHLAQSGLIDSHLDNSFLNFSLDTILWNSFLATNFL